MKTTKVLVEYVCQACGRISFSEEEDTFCESLPTVGKNEYFRVGDIVAIGRGFPTIARIIEIGYKRIGSRSGPSIHRMAVVVESERLHHNGKPWRTWYTPETLLEMHHRWCTYKKEETNEGKKSVKILAAADLVNLEERGYKPE